MAKPYSTSRSRTSLLVGDMKREWAQRTTLWGNLGLINNYLKVTRGCVLKIHIREQGRSMRSSTLSFYVFYLHVLLLTWDLEWSGLSCGRFSCWLNWDVDPPTLSVRRSRLHEKDDVNGTRGFTRFCFPITDMMWLA